MNAYIGWELLGEPGEGSASSLHSVRTLEALGAHFAILDSVGTDASESATLGAALSVTTSRIGLVPALAPWQQSPFHTARALATLDHLTQGRAGWYVEPNWRGSRFSDDSGRWTATGDQTFADLEAPLTEYLDIVVALWDSWDAGAIIADVEAGQYVDPARVHAINYTGDYFSSRGPLNLPRTPQGRPVIMASVTSPAVAVDGVTAEAVAADVVIIRADGVAAAREAAELIRTTWQNAGRPAGRILLAVSPVLPFRALSASGASSREDDALPSLLVRGTPSEIIGEFTAAVSATGADGVLFTGIRRSVDVCATANQLLPLLAPPETTEPRLLRDSLDLAEARFASAREGVSA